MSRLYIRKLGRIFAGLTLLTLVVAGLNTATVSADSTDGSGDKGAIELLQQHCKAKLGKKKEGVCTTDAVTRARNVATYQCKDKSTENNEMYRCMMNNAKEYINKAAKKPNDFKKELEKVLKDAGGNPDKPTDESKKGASPETTIIDEGEYSLGGKVKTNDRCGGTEGGDPNDNSVRISVNIGCRGKGNPILDATFAIIRFLSNGVGLVLIGSLIFGGIQFTTSRGDPQNTAVALNRIKSVLGALLIFIFTYAILNYLIPGITLQ